MQKVYFPYPFIQFSAMHTFICSHLLNMSFSLGVMNKLTTFIYPDIWRGLTLLLLLSNFMGLLKPFVLILFNFIQEGPPAWSSYTPLRSWSSQSCDRWGFCRDRDNRWVGATPPVSLHLTGVDVSSFWMLSGTKSLPSTWPTLAHSSEIGRV